jgi:hypothetical protein
MRLLDMVLLSIPVVGFFVSAIWLKELLNRGKGKDVKLSCHIEKTSIETSDSCELCEMKDLINCQEGSK